MFVIISKQLLLSVNFQILRTLLNNTAIIPKNIDIVIDFIR